MPSERASAYSEPGYATSKTGKPSLPWYLPSIDKNLVPEVRINSTALDPSPWKCR